MAPRKVDLVVVGSVALDTIETLEGVHADLAGGSASYACVAGAPYASCGMVGVVGSDFPAELFEMYRACGIDTRGLQVAEGLTFRWSGRYSPDLNSRATLSTALNVFEHFDPRLPQAYTRAPFLLLGNISPSLQLRVLEQMHAPRFVMADTMDLWIRNARAELLEVIRKVDLLTLNDEEACLLTGARHLTQAAAQLLNLGPRFVLIKKGEHGCLLAAPDALRLLPAYPVEVVRDPTGAGDSFAGACLAVMAGMPEALDIDAIGRALLYGTISASFAVEHFSVAALAKVSHRALDERRAAFRAMLLS